MKDPVQPGDYICPEHFHSLPNVRVWIPAYNFRRLHREIDAADGARIGLCVDALPDSGIVVTSVHCSVELAANLRAGPYVIICHRLGTDETLQASTVAAVRGRVAAWLSNGIPQPMDGVEIMPVGFPSLADGPGHPQTLAAVLTEGESAVVNRVFGCFTVPPRETHTPAREAARQFCLTHPFVTWTPAIDFAGFCQQIRCHEFTLSPPGGGPDCPRTWKTIYLNRIPLVQRNAISDAFADLPIAFYDRLEQIDEAWLDNQAALCSAKSAVRASLSHWIARARGILAAAGG